MSNSCWNAGKARGLHLVRIQSDCSQTCHIACSCNSVITCTFFFFFFFSKKKDILLILLLSQLVIRDQTEIQKWPVPQCKNYTLQEVIFPSLIISLGYSKNNLIVPVFHLIMRYEPIEVLLTRHARLFRTVGTDCGLYTPN